MNITIYNQAKPLIESLGIDVIKSVSGIFSIPEIKEMIGTMYYERLLIDVTALKDYQSKIVLQNLASAFDMSKVVLILENNENGANPAFISGLISLGIYNFTRNSEGLKYLLKNSNTYNDVAHLHQTAVTTKQENNISEPKVLVKKKIIGLVNVTEHAGASTLAYAMLKNFPQTERAIIIELNKFDFKYFHRLEMISAKPEELNELINDKYADVSNFIIDLNNSEDYSMCTDVLYLIEPSIIKMNKLTASNNSFMTDLKFKKVVLNQSNISAAAVHDFEQETGLPLFAVIHSFNDRDEHNLEVIKLMEKLGLVTDSIPDKKTFFSA